MNIRNALGALALLFASVGSQAQGIYSGIWQSNNGEFLLMQQSGTSIIATTYHNEPATNINVPMANGQLFRISSLDIGDLLSGSVVNGFGRIAGIAAFRACEITLDLAFFSPTRMTAEFVYTQPTPEGAAQGINCLQHYNVIVQRTGTLRTFIKIF